MLSVGLWHVYCQTNVVKTWNYYSCFEKMAYIY